MRRTDDALLSEAIEDLDDQTRLPEVEGPDDRRQDEVEEERPTMLTGLTATRIVYAVSLLVAGILVATLI